MKSKVSQIYTSCQAQSVMHESNLHVIPTSVGRWQVRESIHQTKRRDLMIDLTQNLFTDSPRNTVVSNESQPTLTVARPDSGLQPLISLAATEQCCLSCYTTQGRCHATCHPSGPLPLQHPSPSLTVLTSLLISMCCSPLAGKKKTKTKPIRLV